MLKGWVKILPFFVVEWFAKKGERFEINTMSSNWDEQGKRIVVRPFPGVYIAVKK